MSSLWKIRVAKATLAFATLVVIAAAVVNLDRRQAFTAPDDGVSWIDNDGAVEAARVRPDSPADRAGLEVGDRLRSIGGVRVRQAAEAAERIFRLGAWSKAEYEVNRGDSPLELEVILGAAPRRRTSAAFLWILGAAHLVIGAFLLWSKGERPIVRHFYLFCLSSFILYAYRYTGELDAFDRLIYWSDVWATALTPALFLHFCLIFPGGRPGVARRLLAVGSYVVACGLIAAYHAVAAGWAVSDAPLLAVRELLDRLSYGILGLELLAGAAALRLGGSREENPVERQQRRWLSYGTFFGALPFCAWYVAPFVAGNIPGPNHTISVFSLAFIPLAFLFALARHRLMDADLVLRRGTAYTLAAATVLAGFYLGVFALSGWRLPSTSGLGPAAWVASVVAVALVFHPFRNWMQRMVDRRYFRERYDYRETLAEFAAELSTETDRDRLLASFTQHLSRTLALERMAIFTAEDGAGGRLRLARSYGLGQAPPRDLDLSFLDPASCDAKNPYLFFESPRWAPVEPVAAREAVADLDLNYYVPCRVQGRVQAWVGLGQTQSGAYLTSEDLSLVVTVSGNFAIALDNARLYRSLESKAAELERLKDYNENIVESLHVGILAVDLDDRVESWNTQLELVFGISRSQAVGRKLDELLPPKLIAEFEKARDEAGVHNIYQQRLHAQDFPAEFRPATTARGGDRERTVNIAIAPLVAKNFDPIGRLIILDDVTERVELEQQVVQADKLSSIGLLAAGVAHEVNTPLAVISSYAQMLAKQVEGDPAQERILEKITKQTFRASGIVNSLLSFSRTSSNAFETIDLTQTVRETLSLIEPQLRKARVRVIDELGRDKIEIRGVADKLQQVFLNLFLNSRDAMSDVGGAIEVESTIDDSTGMARLVVSDSGPGIPREKLARIFDPFFTTKGGKGGTGLGLAVSYGIIKEHGGTIRAESVPGEGASFTIELPLARKPVHA